MFSVGTCLCCKVEVGITKLDSSRYLMECRTTPSAYRGALTILSTMHELSSANYRLPHKFQASVHGPNGRLFPCGADVMLGFYNKAKQMDVLLRPVIACRMKNHHRISSCLGNREPWSNNMLCNCFWFDVSRTSLKSNHPAEIWTNDFSAGSMPCSTGAVPDVSVDDVPHEERLDSPGISFNQKLPGDNILKLISGSCYLPHPEKEETGGEDAHFISNEHAIGVADGVGGWVDLGIDAGHYARELMSHSVSAIEEEPKGSIDPARVLEKAYFSTKAKGSSTACIIALTNQGIHAVNLGDSGFIIVRDGCVVFQSPVQQHDFNFTFQLESGNASDLPSSGQVISFSCVDDFKVFTFPIVAGDVIVAGTDGLFDNLYKNEVASVVVQATRAGLGPQVAAQKIAALARQRAQDRHRQTPFSAAAQEAGYRYYGGKLDDITVVVSYVTVASP